jgi:23S rRNA pseudouridine1911/1915/1917 synthase
MDIFMKIIAQKVDRLDKTLQKEINQPRNQVENFIKMHGVKVNEKLIKKSGYKLKIGDTIEYIPIKVEEQRESIKDVDFDIEIIYEDDDLMVLNKPPFLVVHPAPSVKEPTLVDWLKQKGISLSTISGEERNGIVHRIDKETSGAILIAKNNKAHQALSKQLEDRSMGRYYLALIDIPLKENIIIEKPIGRDPNNRIKMAIVNDGREAKSAFIKLATSESKHYELIGAKLFTGRTHQIRVHLKKLSRHILGDTIYGFKSKKGKIERVMLHARLIYFIHPTTGEKIVKEAPLFEDFNNILKDAFLEEKINETVQSTYIINSFRHAF